MEARARDFGELRKLVEGSSAEEAEAKAADFYGGPEETLDVLFALFQDSFVPENASGVAGEFQFDVTTPAGVREYTVLVADGRCETRRGASASATAVTAVGLGDFLLLSTGQTSGFHLSAEKRLTTRGDLGAAIGFKDWFRLG
uniref:Uncharacterized protein pnxQ n=1 Tax=Streptomyces sp. TA-0256 TaxID=573242 RepID=E5RLN8_9ACTN|nr:hypothetical protein [Streptomyces sp. TA-0256]